MAEFVQLRKELCLTEYEQMKKLQIFNEDEIRKIKRTRENYEYKIERQQKEIRDFCEYIKYERGILSIISDRRKILHVKEKKALERIIAMKIRGLYKKVLARFPKDLRLWESFVKFCKGFHFTGEISEAIDRMLQFHSDKPEVWLKAVMWEYIETKNMIRVKHLLTTSLKHHPTCIDLHKAFIQIELDEVQAAFDCQEKTTVEENEIALALTQCFTFYKNSKTIIDDVGFYLELLDVTQKFPYAKNLTKEIVSDVQEKYETIPKTWHFFAQSELHGRSFQDLDSLEERSTRQNIQKCVETYQNGLQKIPCEELCSLYIDTILALNDDMTNEPSLKRKSLGNAFKTGHDLGLMSSNHYLLYLKLLIEAGNDQETFIQNVFEKSLIQHPNCTELWELRILYATRYESDLIVKSIFDKAISKVNPDRALPLWRALFNYYATQPNNNQALEEFFQKAVNSEQSVISSNFKPDYIEWICLIQNLSSARQTYKQLTLNSTPCLELHKKMAHIEMSQLKVEKIQARQCFEYAVQFFGKTNIQIWLEYICFERDYGDAKLVGNIYERARNVLTADLVTQFIEQHNLLISDVVGFRSIFKEEPDF